MVILFFYKRDSSLQGAAFRYATYTYNRVFLETDTGFKFDFQKNVNVI
jgi:hypothetical protein